MTNLFIRLCLTITISTPFLHLAAQPKDTIPEMRAVWIATVDNIDWPEKPTINSDEQKASFIRLLDMHKETA